MKNRKKKIVPAKITVRRTSDTPVEGSFVTVWLAEDIIPEHFISGRYGEGRVDLGGEAEIDFRAYDFWCYNFEIRKVLAQLTP